MRPPSRLITKALCKLALCAMAAIALPAQTFTTLYSFCAQNACADGVHPFAGLVQETDGDLYGTTNGAVTKTYSTYGTVFKLALGLGPFVKTQTPSGRAERPSKFWEPI